MSQFMKPSGSYYSATRRHARQQIDTLRLMVTQLDRRPQDAGLWARLAKVAGEMADEALAVKNDLTTRTAPVADGQMAIIEMVARQYHADNLATHPGSFEQCPDAGCGEARRALGA